MASEEQTTDKDLVCALCNMHQQRRSTSSSPFSTASVAASLDENEMDNDDRGKEQHEPGDTVMGNITDESGMMQISTGAAMSVEM